jgi:hypothetical protein
MRRHRPIDGRIGYDVSAPAAVILLRMLMTDAGLKLNLRSD